MKRILSVAIAAVASAALCGVAHADTRVSFYTGLDYSSGDYGTNSTTTVYSVPLTVRVANGDWAVRASIPYLQIHGDVNVVDVIDGGAEAPTTVTRRGTERGFGDTTLSLTRTFSNIVGAHTYLDVTGRVRLPTGDDNKGLGVGATDYGLGGELGVAKDAGGAYINIGRRFLGDPHNEDRVDGWQGVIGGYVKTSEHFSVGASYYWRDASFRGGEDPSELGGYVTYRASNDWRITLNASAGLSDGSPDTSVGIRFNYRPTFRRGPRPQ
ncbi:MAG: hypothetical protein QM759_05210 [Terricaulis sp.]